MSPSRRLLVVGRDHSQSPVASSRMDQAIPAGPSLLDQNAVPCACTSVIVPASTMMAPMRVIRTMSSPLPPPQVVVRFLSPKTAD
jgi:hypothetical protein